VADEAVDKDLKVLLKNLLTKEEYALIEKIVKSRGDLDLMGGE
jgi:hypothetical protein